MERSVKHEQAVSDELLEKMRSQIDSLNELIENVNSEIGQPNRHAKKLASLKTELESVYSKITKYQRDTMEKYELESNSVSGNDIAKSIHVKRRGKLSTSCVDNINYYIRYLKNEAEVYLLYEFFDLIVSKVKEYGCYDADQIWSGIYDDIKARLSNNKSSISNMRDILNNSELKEGLNAYATFQLEKKQP